MNSPTTNNCRNQPTPIARTIQCPACLHIFDEGILPYLITIRKVRWQRWRKSMDPCTVPCTGDYAWYLAFFSSGFEPPSSCWNVVTEVLGDSRRIDTVCTENGSRKSISMSCWTWLEETRYVRVDKTADSCEVERNLSWFRCAT